MRPSDVFLWPHSFQLDEETDLLAPTPNSSRQERQQHYAPPMPGNPIVMNTMISCIAVPYAAVNGRPQFNHQCDNDSFNES